MELFENIECITSKQGVFIHPTAIVAKTSKLGVGVKIGPRAVIGANVCLGDNVMVGVGSVIEGHTIIGNDSKIYSYATLGTIPQDLKFKGVDTKLIIGKKNLIREYVNISLGTDHGNYKTVIGDNNLFMAYCHIGHDCIIGNNNIFANCVHIAGHIEIGNRVTFGGMSGAHQFCKFGDYAMIAGGAMCTQDVLPFTLVHGNRARFVGLNMIGLKRNNVKNISIIKKMIRILFEEKLTKNEAITKIIETVEDCEEKVIFVTFLQKSSRGICR